MNNMHLSYGECHLQPYTKDCDKKTVFWLSNPYIKKTFGITYDVDELQHRKWIESQPNLKLWSIHFQENYIGNVSIRVIERHKKAYFEMYIGEEKFRGRGIGKTVVRLVIDYVFESLNFNRIYLYTNSENDVNNKFYRDIGFSLEGRERQSILDSNGKYVDQNIWGLLRSEYVG